MFVEITSSSLERMGSSWLLFSSLWYMSFSLPWYLISRSFLRFYFSERRSFKMDILSCRILVYSSWTMFWFWSFIISVWFVSFNDSSSFIYSRPFSRSYIVICFYSDRWSDESLAVFLFMIIYFIFM